MLKTITAAILLLGLSAGAQNFDKVTIEAIPMRGSVSMLTGSGGNLGVSSGDDGIFLIDDQFAPLTEKIRAAAAKLGPGPIKFLINTHWHADHTGGNENLGSAGTVLVAHENVRSRLESGGMTGTGRSVEPAPRAALPVITYPEKINFHLNGDTIRVIHAAHAHTDGDSMIYFEKADVLHAGDVFFNGAYPFVDLRSGGSLDGLIAAVKTALTIGTPAVKIIPGHGGPAVRADLKAYLAMIEEVRALVGAAVGKGHSREKVLADDPIRHLHGHWGGGFMKPQVFLGIIYDDLKRSL